MNIDFLGDALDHWKGSIFRLLSQEKLLVDFKVDLMATDAKKWREEDYALFARLLGVSVPNLVRHKAFLNNGRAAYFDELMKVRGDLFLDPDTGVATSKANEPWKYVSPGELRQLLQSDESRVVSVYQHVSRQITRERVKKVVDVVLQQDRRIACCSYESPSVAMLFFSANISRIKAIDKYFSALLGRHADGRVYRQFPGE